MKITIFISMILLALLSGCGDSSTKDKSENNSTILPIDEGLKTLTIPIVTIDELNE